LAEERSDLITSRPVGLVDVLDRILDKGLVIAGDIKVSLVNVELLTLKIRLLVCSIDKAEEIGLNWWRFDRDLVVQPDVVGDQQGSREESAPLPEPRPADGDDGVSAPATDRSAQPSARRGARNRGKSGA
jgi:hypothetical protein